MLVGFFGLGGHDKDPPAQEERGEARSLPPLCQHPRPLCHRVSRLHDVEHQISQA